MTSGWQLVLVIFLLVAPSADAASLRFDNVPGSGVWSLYLNGEAENGNFDTVIVSVEVDDPGLPFESIDEDGFVGSTPLTAGDPYTFVNPYLAAPTFFGGNGYVVLGQSISATSLAFTVGPLGGTIDTVNDPNVGSDGLFLANFFHPAGTASYLVQLVSGGTVIQDRVGIPLIPFEPLLPEPTSAVLIGCAGVALLCQRSGYRNSQHY